MAVRKVFERFLNGMELNPTRVQLGSDRYNALWSIMKNSPLRQAS